MNLVDIGAEIRKSPLQISDFHDIQNLIVSGDSSQSRFRVRRDIENNGQGIFSRPNSIKSQEK